MVCRNVFPKNLSFDIVREPCNKNVDCGVKCQPSICCFDWVQKKFSVYYFPFHIPTRLAYADDVNILGGSIHV